MINKEHLWFLTLFSLILVLSVYYVTMPSDLLLSNQEFKDSKVEEVSLDVEESDVLVSLRLDLEESRENEKKELQTILTNNESTMEEKNNAYEKISQLNNVYNEEEKLEKKVKECCNIDSFVEINDNEISVVGLSNNHSKSLANDIMRAIQEQYTEQVIVTVNFK